jgi:hypothetical protein
MELLMAEREIRQVLLRYCRGVDRADPELIRECYHEGALDVHGKYRGDGRAFADYAVGVLNERYQATSHTLENSMIEFDGDACAHVETYVVAYHLSIEPVEQAHFYVFGGRYVDQFELRGDAWRIAHRQLLRDWSYRHPLDPEEVRRQAEEAQAFDGGRRDRDDVGYPAAFQRMRAAATGP